jgi:transposase InsO family protein
VSPRLVHRQHLLLEIQKIFTQSRGTYGSPRITRELQKKGIVANENTVADIMKENGIQAKQRKKFKATTDSNHKLPVAKNRLKRKFTTSKPNQVWVTDITYVRTDEGWLFLAAFIDLFSRKVVG